MSREDRRRQLLSVAWQLVRNEGTDALTLGYLAERAGVTKPVVTITSLLAPAYWRRSTRTSMRGKLR